MKETPITLVLSIGCCGWAEKGGMSSYFRSFKLVEVQSTFYNLPRIETVQRWRRASPQDFEYTLKAWQAITHPLTSATWKRVREKVSMNKEDRYGYFRQSEENFQAWKRTKDVCEALNANICVLQSPASFRPTEQNCKNILSFMSSIDRGRLQIAWEPRGEWREHEDKVRTLCKKLNLIHVVDPFRWIPLSEIKVSYLRLHGIGKGETNYGYRYTTEDLRSLLRIVQELEKSNDRIYVLFNNLSMANDAKRFIELAKRTQLI